CRGGATASVTNGVRERVGECKAVACAIDDVSTADGDRAALVRRADGDDGERLAGVGGGPVVRQDRNHVIGIDEYVSRVVHSDGWMVSTRLDADGHQRGSSSAVAVGNRVLELLVADKILGGRVHQLGAVL